MENKRNGCGCNGLTKKGSDESLSASPKPIEMRADKGTMTRVGNQIQIGQNAFSELRTAAQKSVQVSRREPMSEELEQAPGVLERSHGEPPSHNGERAATAQNIGEPSDSSYAIFLTDFEVPLAGARPMEGNPARFLLQDGSGNNTPEPTFKGEKNVRMRVWIGPTAASG